MSEALFLRSVGLCRGRRSVLEDLTFTLDEGAFLGLLGPNGAGKTTLLEAMVAALPYTGELRVLGREVRGLTGVERSRFRASIGLVPQLGATDPGVPLTVEEVVRIGRAGRAGLFHALSQQDRRICRSWLDRLGLTHLATRPYTRLSGGERRKVHLARALAQEPRMLLLDEPAGHLDLRWQEELTLLIDQLWRDTRTTVVMVTHEVRHLPPACNRLALIGHGRLLAFGSPDEVLQPRLLSAAFEVPLEVVRRHDRTHVLPAGRAEGA